MRKWTGRRTAAAVIAGAFLGAAAAVQAAQIVSGPCQSNTDPTQTAGSGCTIEPGGSARMLVSLTTEGDDVAALQNDLVFSTHASAAQQFPASTTTTAAITAKDTAIPVADASVLPDFGIVQIVDEQIAYGSKTGNTLNVADDSMVCNPDGSQPADCSMDSDCTGQGQLCVPAGRGQNGTTAAAHASGKDVGLPADIPDCKMTDALAALNKSAVFSFLPSGCTPGTDCTGIRAIVVAIDENVSELIPDGTDLYTCKIGVTSGGPSGTVGNGFETLVCPDMNTDPGSGCTETTETQNGCPAGQICINQQCFEEAESSTPPPPVLNNTTCEANQVRLCIGDCNLDRQVFGNEVTIAIQIVAGNQPIENCLAADGNNDGSVFGNEVTQAIVRLSNVCPGAD